MKITTFCSRSEIIAFADIEDYKFKKQETYLLIFVKGDVQLNIWLGKRGPTVATILTHPKFGRNCLYRRGVSNVELMWIFKNPRAHINKGYRSK